MFEWSTESSGFWHFLIIFKNWIIPFALKSIFTMSPMWYGVGGFVVRLIIFCLFPGCVLFDLRRINYLGSLLSRYFCLCGMWWREPWYIILWVVHWRHIPWIVALWLDIFSQYLETKHWFFVLHGILCYMDYCYLIDRYRSCYDVHDNK